MNAIGARRLGPTDIVLQKSFNDCGAATIVNFSKLIGKPIALSGVDHLDLSIFGLSITDVRDALSQHGIATQIALPQHSLQHIRFPAIALLHNHYFVLVKRLYNNEVETYDPWLGHIAVSSNYIKAEFPILLELYRKK